MNPQLSILCDDRKSVQENASKRALQNVRLTAVELAKVELLIETTRPVTLVVPQTDKEEYEGNVPGEKLQAYAPMYTTLIEPPYELAPNMPFVVALQSELFTFLMYTLTPLAVVNPHLLLLLLLEPSLQAYPPRYNENEPPYAFP